MPKERAPRATPALTEPSESVTEKIAAARTHIQAMKDSEEWPTAPKVQKAADTWSTANDDLAAQYRRVLDFEKELDVARSHLEVVERRWSHAENGVLASVAVHCDGNANKVKKLGYRLRTWTPRAPHETPEGLQGKRGKPRTATATWETHRHDDRTYQVQHATRPDDASTHSEPIVVRGGKLVLDDQTPGETIHFRVRTIDAKIPSGYTEWTAWVAVMVSA